MDNALHVLIVEDSENDTALIMRQLEKAKYAVTFQRVDRPEEMQTALSRASWDIILSDYNMPQFDALSALKLLLKSGQDIPFVVVSGTIGEETAVELMRAGAHDYLMKDKLTRLAPVVKREILDARARAERRATEKALVESEVRLRNLVETARDIVFTLTPEGIFTTINPAFEVLTGWPISDWLGRSFEELLIPDDIPKAIERVKSVIAGNPHAITELRVRTKKGTMMHAELVATQHLLQGEVIEILGIARDITERKEAELALRKNESLLSDAMRIARLGAWEHDMANDVFTFNDNFYAIYRTTAQAAGGYRMSSAEYVRRYVHPEDVVRVGAEIRKALESSQSHATRRLEHRFLYADGEVGFLEVSIFVVKDDQGRILRTYGVNQDITDRKRAEEELRKLSSAVQQSPASIIITNTKGIIDYVNPKFSELSGYTSDEVLGKNVNVLKTGMTPPEAYTGLWQTIATGKEWHGEFRSKRKNGEVYWEFASISPITNNKGVITHFLSVQEDITDRKESERALRESEKRYRDFFEDDLTGDFISTVEGKILSCNPAFARIYGFGSVEEVMSTSAESLYTSKENREAYLDVLRERKKLEYYEEEGRRKDGKAIYLVSNLIGIFDERGELVRIKGYVFDNTERRLLEEQLRQSQKMESIGTLAGGIAHDFNNILNNILGFVMQLKKYSNDPVKVLKYGETIEKSATRGAELSAHLLSVSRRKKREDAEFDVGQLVGEIATLCTETFPRIITINKTIGENIAPIKGDRGSLYQVLLNLSVNARDAMPNGGTLSISVENRLVGGEVNSKLFPPNTSRCVELLVSDTGSGMSDAVREKIFDPFFTTKEQGKGTGLGLSIVYNVVKEHHGTILVESEEGAGTTFKVYLPAVEPRPPQDASTAPAVFVSHGELVLLVDDEEMMQELGKELLEDNGFNVLIARDGVEALEIYRQRGKEISLVILDLVMPRMDGGQTYMELKKIDDNVKAFFCSGFTSDKVITQLLEEEHLHAIKKPFHPTDFINMVQSTIQGG